MGSLSIWHAAVLLVLLAVPVGIGLLVWLLVRASRRKAAPVAADTSPSSRLKALDELRAQGLVSSDEYEQRRSAILASV